MLAKFLLPLLVAGVLATPIPAGREGSGTARKPELSSDEFDALSRQERAQYTGYYVGPPQPPKEKLPQTHAKIPAGSRSPRPQNSDTKPVEKRASDDRFPGFYVGPPLAHPQGSGSASQTPPSSGKKWPSSLSGFPGPEKVDNVYQSPAGHLTTTPPNAGYDSGSYATLKPESITTSRETTGAPQPKRKRPGN
ncbi:hypothetical protein ACKVWC_003256 [Pyricularia oryzae]